MMYCKLHQEKGYTTEEADKMAFCPHAGLYVGSPAYLVRVYCFWEVDQHREEVDKQRFCEVC